MVEQSPRADKMPDEVFSVIYEAAHAENRLRDRGYTQRRIGHLVGIQVSKDLINLQLQKIDTSQAFPPKKAEPELVGVDTQLTSEEEARVDHLVDTGALTYDEAIQRIKNARR